MEKTELEIEQSKAAKQAKRAEQRERAKSQPKVRTARPEGLGIIDTAALRKSMKDTAEKIVALKKIMRASGHMITAREFYALQDLKSEATALCILRARSRGRFHGGSHPETEDAIALDVAERFRAKAEPEKVREVA